MKRILVLTPRFPYPVIGGDRLRIYKLCEALSKSYSLTLLSLCETKDELNYQIKDDVFSEVHRVFLPKYRSILNCVIRIPTSLPLQIAYYKSREYEKKVAELLPLHDGSLSHLIRVGDYVRYASGKNILEMTDAISLNYKRVCDLGDKKSLRGLIYRFEQKRLEMYERTVAQDFEMVSLVSEVDRNYLFSDVNVNAKVYSNGVDTEMLIYRKRTINTATPVELVFIGNMHSLQNMDAVKWFAKNILPNLNKTSFQYRLKVIGKIRENDALTLNNLPNVFCTGSVPDINEAAATGHIGICPVRLGAGIQNKVLEYMSLGLPCITSEVGFEGIGAVRGREIMVANSCIEYINSLEEIILQPDLYNSISLNARKFVEDKFSWHSKLAPFVSDVHAIVGE